MGFKFIIIFLLILLTSCTPVFYKYKPEELKVEIDYDLLNQSDYVDIVYVNGNFSYISYFKNNKKQYDQYTYNCTDENPIYQPKLGIWIWDFNKILGKENEVIKKLKNLNINKIYLQIDDDLVKFLPFFNLAKKVGIEVFALDGRPQDVNNPSLLINRVQRVLNFNEECKCISGFQIDVEPYLIKDFNINLESYTKKYVDMIRKIKEILNKKMLFSIVIPFWFDQIQYDNKPLSFYITEIADEVVVMSYRTNLSEILEISNNELCYASKIQKPLYLGLEINPLPLEEHYLVHKDEIKRNIFHFQENKVFLIKLPHNGLKYFGTYKVLPEKITFYQNRKFWDILKKTIKKKSFAGWVIHSFEGLLEINHDK
jgi:hypothetical protein